MASDRKDATREAVRRHRERMRESGLRPVQLWVADVRDPRFAAEVRRQCEVIGRSPSDGDDQRFVDDLSDGLW